MNMSASYTTGGDVSNSRDGTPLDNLSEVEKNSEPEIIKKKNFTLLDPDDDDFSVDSEAGYISERKDRTFEFSDSKTVMRIIRLVLVIQVIAFVTDNPSIQIPILFRIISFGPLFYAIRFYSRPFIDFVYVFQYLMELLSSTLDNWSTGRVVFDSPDISQTPNVARHLSQSDYATVTSVDRSFDITVNFINTRNWHAFKHFSHFFLGILFAVMAVLFTLTFWEIKDYTNRFETRMWLNNYIIDGWWRRGGLRVAINIFKGCAAISFYVFTIFVIARGGFNNNAVPEDRMNGGVLAILGSVVFIIWLIGYLLLRSTESAFMRFVSQNVSYTSSIILKKVVKSKVEVGLGLMFILYSPILYNFVASITYAIDWNDTLAPAHRKNINFYTACYFIAFPPLSTGFHIDPKTCPVASSLSKDSYLYGKQMYNDLKILPCDSYLGILIYTTGLIATVFMLIGYSWIFIRLILLSAKEFRNSRWTRDIKTIISIHALEKKHYEKNFPFIDRLVEDIRIEIVRQLYFLKQIPHFISDIILNTCHNILKIIFIPIKCLIQPVIFLSVRMFGLECLKSNDKEIGNDDNNNGVDISQVEFHLSDGIKSSTEHVIGYIISILTVVTPVRSFQIAKSRLGDKIRNNKTLTNLRTQTHFMFSSSKSKSMGSIGSDKHAMWRKDLKMDAKSRLLQHLLRRRNRELEYAKKEYITDHALIITIFDRTIDSGGLSLLISQFQYSRLEFCLFLVLEMTLYAIFTSLINFYSDWVSRTIMVMTINIIFGIITYLLNPFISEVDIWLDFFGRLLVCSICLGIIICDRYLPNVNGLTGHVAFYRPWESFSILTSINFADASVYLFVDLGMVIFMYTYILYIIDLCGAFLFIKRSFASFKFGFHDHILDFLVSKLDERTLGVENIFTGMLLVQQWDDIIRDQRRMALLTWPDVRPPHLLEFSTKILQVKWASMFNLNIDNLRSSLGLTLLHTVMCSANGECSKWIMNTYPSLLNIEDSQRDTPITIALKECSYYLCKYSKQNDGALDDGTSYSDNEFNNYYPEIENLRDLAIHYGEFIRDNCDVYILNAEEAVSLKELGFFKELQGLFEIKPTFYGKILTQRQAIKEAAEAAAALERELIAPGDGPKQVVIEETINSLARKKAKEDADAVVAERQSLFSKRFPEDDVMDDFEFGQMSSWGIVGLSVPDVNLFINDDDISDGEFDKNDTINDDGEDFLSSKQFIVKSTKKMMKIKSEFVVTKDHHVVSKLKDWDYIKKSKKSLQNKSTFQSIMDSKKVFMDGGGGDEPISYNAQQLARDREIRFKICKFAEILLSEEIVKNCKNMKWDLVTYKELNKLNSSEQGRLCQNLAMVCALNPPPRFTRISEWNMGVSKNVFDEYPEEPRNPVVHYSVAIVEGVSNIGKMVSNVMDNMRNIRGGRFFDDNATDKTGAINTGAFGDRIIQVLAECFVSCSQNLLLSDCELSVYGRAGWRAMVRALRRQNCTFVLPSIFVGPKKITIRFLDLSRNELDDGDCVLISEIFLYQQTIVHANLSFNRIGSRGVSRIVKVLKGHQSINAMYLHNNRIGPGCAKDIGVWLKQTTTLKVLDLSHNRLGELIRYPTLLCRERIISAVRDIFFGVKNNKSLQILDVSYNHLGPKCADIVPVSVNRHPRLSSLNLSGNDIGPTKGASMIFALAGDSGGELSVEAKISLLSSLKNKSENIEVKKKHEELQVKLLAMKKSVAEKKKKLGLSEDEDEKSTMLANIELADNRLGRMAGYALGVLLQKNKFLTSLDVSSNSLGYDGGLALTEGLERVYGVLPRDFFKLTLHRLEEEQYHGRDAKVRKKVWTNLISLNLSRNGLGPDVLSSIMHCMASKKCTITDLNLSDNPLGDNLLYKGDPDSAGIDARVGMGTSGTLTQLNLSNCMFSPVQIVPMIGGLSENDRILKLIFQNTYIDEPCCLQLMHALKNFDNIIELNLKNCRMGPKGSGIVVNSIIPLATQLIYLDLTGNKMGPSVSVPFSIALADPLCTIRTLNVADNDFTETGGIFLSQGIIRNKSLEQIDISSNHLTLKVVEVLSDPANGLSHISQLKRFIISNNPLIGNIGAHMLMKSLASGPIEHIEVSNIGAGQRSALLISKALRDVELAWRYVDISSNNLSREGLNEIFWSMRQNRSIRVLLIGGNMTGPLFGSENDAKLVHGIALPRAIRANVLIRELDLSYNGMSAKAGCLLLDAMVDNYTIRRLSVRGNYFDDSVASMLADILKYNNVLEYFDIGQNKLGYNSCFSIAEGLECNRSLKTFCADYNLLGNAGTATTEAFCRALMMNYSLRTLVLDGNKFGPEWGIQLGHMISRNNTLTHISLRDNRFDIRSGKCLVNSYEHNYHLMELALSAHEIGEKLWERFKMIYNKRRSTIGPDDIIFETKFNIKDDIMMKAYE